MATREKTGGRQVGSKNRVSDSMRRDILSVYRKLGGQKFLLSWAKENGTEYVKQCLARVMPPMPRPALDEQEEAEFGMPAELNFEAARRIAFILSRAEAMSRPLDVEMVEISPPAPKQQDPAPLPPLDEAPVVEPCAIPTSYPKGDPEGVEETRAETLETFRGTVPAEQGRTHARPDVIDQRRKAHDEYVSRLTAHHRRSLI